MRLSEFDEAVIALETLKRTEAGYDGPTREEIAADSELLSRLRREHQPQVLLAYPYLASPETAIAHHEAQFSDNLEWYAGALAARSQQLGDGIGSREFLNTLEEQLRQGFPPPILVESLPAIERHLDAHPEDPLRATLRQIADHVSYAQGHVHDFNAIIDEAQSRPWTEEQEGIYVRGLSNYEYPVDSAANVHLHVEEDIRREMASDPNLLPALRDKHSPTIAIQPDSPSIPAPTLETLEEFDRAVILREIAERYDQSDATYTPLFTEGLKTSHFTLQQNYRAARDHAAAEAVKANDAILQECADPQYMECLRAKHAGALRGYVPYMEVPPLADAEKRWQEIFLAELPESERRLLDRVADHLLDARIDHKDSDYERERLADDYEGEPYAESVSLALNERLRPQEERLVISALRYAPETVRDAFEYIERTERDRLQPEHVVGSGFNAILSTVQRLNQLEHTPLTPPGTGITGTTDRSHTSTRANTPGGPQ